MEIYSRVRATRKHKLSVILTQYIYFIVMNFEFL